MNAALKSWKTTVAGLACLAVVAAFGLGRITVAQMLQALGVLMGGGLICAKDGGVQ